MKEVKALMFKDRINLSDLEKNGRQIFFFSFFHYFLAFSSEIQMALLNSFNQGKIIETILAISPTKKTST